MPKHSPKVARTLGAVCTTTCLDGSRSAAHTLAVSSFSVSAPVGHTAMHWPQETQGESPKGALKRAADVRGEAALVGADHAHGLVGLAGGHTAAAQDALVVVAHHMRRGIVDGVGARRAADEVACRRRRSSLAELLQLAVAAAHAGQAVLVVGGKQQLQVRLAGRPALLGVLVTISMPSLTGYTQAVTRLRAPLTSTTQIRHAPISLISFR